MRIMKNENNKEISKESLLKDLKSPLIKTRTAAIDYLVQECIKDPLNLTIPLEELGIGWGKDIVSCTNHDLAEFQKSFVRNVVYISSKSQWESFFNFVSKAVTDSDCGFLPREVFLEIICKASKEYRVQWVEFLKNHPKFSSEDSLWLYLMSHIIKTNRDLAEDLVDIMVARKSYLAYFPWEWNSFYPEESKYIFDQFPDKMSEIIEALSELNDEESVGEPLKFLMRVIEDQETFRSYQIYMKKFYMDLVPSQLQQQVKDFLKFSKKYATPEFQFFCLQTRHQQRTLKASDIFDHGNFLIEFAKNNPESEADIFKIFDEAAKNEIDNDDGLKIIFSYFRSLIIFAGKRKDALSMKKYVFSIKRSFPSTPNETMLCHILYSVDKMGEAFKDDIRALIELYVEKSFLHTGTRKLIEFLDKHLEYFDYYWQPFKRVHTDQNSFNLLWQVVGKEETYPEFYKKLMSQKHYQKMIEVETN